jgi:hypothetical protein
VRTGVAIRSLIAGLSLLAACSEKTMTVEELLAQHEDRLMAIPGVEGVGIGGSTDSPIIIIMVRQGATEMAEKLPRELGGYPVRIEVSGEIVAF